MKNSKQKQKNKGLVTDKTDDTSISDNKLTNKNEITFNKIIKKENQGLGSDEDKDRMDLKMCAKNKDCVKDDGLNDNESEKLENKESDDNENNDKVNEKIDAQNKDNDE